MLTLETVQQRCHDCRSCSLANVRTNVVFGEGNPLSRLVLVGEGPGQDEDETGRPFVGRAGILLRTTLGALGLDPAVDLYIANVVKCRPPSNRVPSVEEIEACSVHLDDQLRLLNPLVVVTLGKTATDALLGTDAVPIGKLRGQPVKIGNTTVLPTFHPSYLARQSAIPLSVKGTTFAKRIKDLYQEHAVLTNTPYALFIKDLRRSRELMEEKLNVPGRSSNYWSQVQG